MCFSNFGEHLAKFKQNDIAQFNVNKKGPPICDLKEQATIYNPIFTIWGLLTHYSTTGKDGRISYGTSVHYYHL